MQPFRVAHEEELDRGVIRSANPENFLPKIGQLPILAGLVLLVAFAGATVLTSILKYKVTVKAPAAIRLGDQIAQIAAGTAPLQIKALVAAQDIGKVKVGQSALMRVSACPYPDYGTLQGQVIAIAPDEIAPSTLVH